MRSINGFGCLIFLTALLMFLGCSDDGSMLEDTDDGVPMGAHLDEMAQTLDLVETLTHEHEEAFSAAPNVDAVDEAVDSYAERLHDHYDKMRDQLEDIEVCTLNGQAPPMHDLDDALHALEEELEHYQETMHGIEDLDVASREYERHHEVMEGILGNLASSRNELHDMGDDYRCTPHDDEDHHEEEDHHDDEEEDGHHHDDDNDEHDDGEEHGDEG